MEKHYKQLNLEERTLIQTQLSMGFKPAQIARELGRSASTICRELKRNGWVRPKAHRSPGRPLVTGGYRAAAAHKQAVASASTPRTAGRLQPGNALWNHVTAYLAAGYSPEQIAGKKKHGVRKHRVRYRLELQARS